MASCTVFVVNLNVLMMVIHTVGVHHNTDLAVLVLRTLIRLSLQHPRMHIPGGYNKYCWSSYYCYQDERCTCDKLSLKPDVHPRHCALLIVGIYDDLIL